MTRLHDYIDVAAGTITIHCTRVVLCFPITEAAAEAMSSEQLRNECRSCDPNGEWGTFTTLGGDCEACEGDGCEKCEWEGFVTREVEEDEVFDEADVFEYGVTRADLIAGALEFGKECLQEYMSEGTR